MDPEQADRVIEAVWPWKNPPPEPAAARDSRGGLKGVGQAMAMGGGAWLLYRYGGQKMLAGLLGILAVGILFGSLWAPRLYRAMERFGRFLGRGVGAGMTWLLLVPFFFLVFLPGRLVLRLVGRDPMRRAFPAPEASCWIPRKASEKGGHYHRQFS